jgi:penicillin-binding protein 1A
VAVLLMLLGAAGLVAYHHFADDLPSTDALRQYRPKTVSYMYAEDGRVIGEFAQEYRLVAPLSRIPRPVIEAFVAAEDANFYQHPGVDLVGMARAFIKNTEAGRIVQGGSTITMQVVRTFLLSRERSYRRKIREALLAYRMEQNLSKDQILFLYLNQIYLGQGAHGVEAAALNYFGKHVEELTLAEAALLAGMAQAPGRYSPFSNPKVVRERQKYVLAQMVRGNFASAEEVEKALAQEMVFVSRPKVNSLEIPYFTEHVRRRLEELYGAERLYQDGLRIYTTVDPALQQAAMAAVARGLEEVGFRQGYTRPLRSLEPEAWAGFEGAAGEALITEVDTRGLRLAVRYQGRDQWLETAGLAWAIKGRAMAKVFSPGDVVRVRTGRPPEPALVLAGNQDIQAALVCLETDTGRVRAMVGGRDGAESQFNRAVQAYRQPGSAFKPFVYAAAMDAGFTPASIVWDEPVEYRDRGGTWSPQNYDRGFLGPVTLYSALVKSRNVVAVRLLEKVGTQKVIEYAHRMGISSTLGPYLSLALGSFEVSLLDMTSAFTTFPNLGRSAEPIFINRIEDRDGRVVREFSPALRPALSPQTAFVMLDMLKGVVDRGTGRRVAQLGRPVAGKTGTSNDQADAWFVGFTPEYAAGVWVGKDKREQLGRREQGGRTAAPIFLYFMEAALAGKPVRDFEPPAGVTYAKIDPETGLFAVEETLNPISICFKSDQVNWGTRSEFTTGLDEEGPKEHVYLIYRNGKVERRVEIVDPRAAAAPDQTGVRPDQPALPRGLTLKVQPAQPATDQ